MWFWKQKQAEVNFVETDNAGNEYSNALSECQQSKAAYALNQLVTEGSITNGDVFYRHRLTDGRKLFTEWRRKGYLRPASDKEGYDWETSPNGGKYKRHYWTGVEPYKGKIIDKEI